MTGSESIPTPTRMILNANLGVTNIIERESIDRDMGKVTDSIFNKLKAHYGPYSRFAGLDPNKPLEDTSFTKDGANIVKSIEFASPLEDWVRRAILYVGTNIEKSAGDGTTSSMMFACGMLKNMSEALSSILPVNYYQFRQDWNEFIFRVKSRMQEFVMTAKNADGTYNRGRVKELAYLQAYTSSHGNEDLAEAVSEMFAHTPESMWGKMTFGRKRYESEKLFDVQKSEHQYEMECDIMSKTVYNKDAGRYLEYDDCTLIIVNGSIEIDDQYWKKIKDHLEKSTPEHPVAIIDFGDHSNATFGELMEMTSAKTEDDKMKYCFAVFGRKPIHPKINDYTNLQAIAGVNLLEYASGEFAGRPLIIEHGHIKYEFEKLSIDGLYEDTREPSDDVRERPYYNDPSKPYFREWVDTLKKYITGYEEAELNAVQSQELHNFRKMYAKLVYDKTYTLVIGGNTFDNLAMFDVVDDVIRATIRSLEKGMVVSNNKTLYWAVEDVANAALQSEKSKHGRVIYWFAQNVLRTLESFSDVVLDQLYPHGKRSILTYTPEGNLFFDFSYKLQNWWDGLTHDLIDNPSIYIPPNYNFTQEERKSFREWWFSNAVNMLQYDNTKFWHEQAYEDHSTKKQIERRSYHKRTMIVQPANADIVMLERFGEIALKFILTERVIVSNSAYLKKEKK